MEGVQRPGRGGRRGRGIPSDLLGKAREAHYQLFHRVVNALYPRLGAIYALADALGTVRYASSWALRGTVGRGPYVAVLRRAFPSWRPRRVERVLRAFWRCHARSFAEGLFMGRVGTQHVGTWLRFRGLEAVDSALGEGRGAILFAPYFGNEKLIHLALGLSGYPIHVLSSRYEDARPRIRALKLDPVRRVHPVHFPDESPRWMYRVLAAGGIVQLSPPADPQPNDRPVAFLGHRLGVSPAALKLAAATGARLLVGFAERTVDHRFDIGLERVAGVDGLLRGASRVGPGVLDGALQELLGHVERRFEAQPEQVYWMWLVIKMLA